MKKTFLFAVCLALIPLLWTGHAQASEATPQEVVQKVTEAAQLVAEKGEAAFAEISDKNGRFVWKDSYCFAYDMTGTIVAHPIKPNLVGKNLMGMKDIKGKMFTAEFVSIAKSASGKGWSDYWWPKPGEKQPSLKVSYIMKVPGKDFFVGAGIYDVSKEEAEKALSQ
ncbi:MAG: cache domain-containing protein [Desulfacinum sp.]|jgi:signal transduction histidine kinase|nr:cache domain-containing protein [Desulfacinum sp.]MBZ4658288.1 cache, type 2 domain protein [Desulfacinum sp.]